MQKTALRVHTGARERRAAEILPKLELPVWLVRGGTSRRVLAVRRKDHSGLGELGFWKDRSTCGRCLHEVAHHGRRTGTRTGSLAIDALLQMISAEVQGGSDQIAYSLRRGAILEMVKILEQHGMQHGSARRPARSRRAVITGLAAMMRSGSESQALAVRDVLLRLAARAPASISGDAPLVELLHAAEGLPVSFAPVVEYASANRRGFAGRFSSRLEPGGEAGELRSAARRELARARNVALIHNIGEALGDEWIRNSYLVTGLLASDSARRLTVFSARPFLYNHPRITVIDPADYDRCELYRSERFDAVFEQLYETDPLAADFGAYAKAIGERAGIVFKTPLGSNYFSTEYESVAINGQRFGLNDEIVALPNPHDYAVRLLSWLDLAVPFPTATGKLLLCGRLNAGALRWWSANVQRNPHANGRRIVFVNPFGGTYAHKGFTAAHDGTLVEQLGRLIRRGAYLLLAPNGRSWGGRARMEAIVAQLPAGLRSRVNLNVPSPLADPFVQPQLMGWADSYIGVEGGGSHLAFGLCDRATVLLVPDSGFQNWFPMLRRPGQRDLMAPCLGR